MRKFVKIFVATLFISLNFGALLYVDSTFLTKFFSDPVVSLLFLLGAVGNIILFVLGPKLLNLFGKKWLFLASLILLAGSTLGLAWSESLWGIALSFVGYSALVFAVYYTIDVFIEEESDDGHTGEIRGAYFTVMNAGIALGPLFLSVLPNDNAHFRRLYWVGFELLIIPILVACYILLTRKHAHKKIVRPWHLLPFRAWWRRRNIRAITLAKLVLETFYAIMVIYLPLYARLVMGFSWAQLAIIFSIALVPFVLVEGPAGVLADRCWGEKEMLTAGFFITGVTVLLIPFLPKSFWLWIVVLFMSRVGAALIEIMCETYFFKKITVHETGFLSIFRLARPVAIILGSLLGALVLGLYSFPILFFVLAGIVLLGIKESLFLTDTL